jgi:hypothetical protein
MPSATLAAKLSSTIRSFSVDARQEADGPGSTILMLVVV